jgi:hypothetical protein
MIAGAIKFSLEGVGIKMTPIGVVIGLVVAVLFIGAIVYFILRK